MYCHRCGTPNADEATTCTNCGTVLVSSGSDSPPETGQQPGSQPYLPQQGEQTPGQPSGGSWYQPGGPTGPSPHQASGPTPQPWHQGAQGVPVAQIPNYLIQSILVTLFCCIPLGVVAIVFAAQVNGKVAQGDIQGAMEASKRAKMFCWISFGIGLVGLVIWSAFVAATFMGGGEF